MLRKINKKTLYGLIIVGIALSMLLISRWVFRASGRGLIYKNIQVNGVAVGGMALEEAAHALNAYHQPSLDGEIIRFEWEGSVIQSIGFSELELRCHYEALAEQAYQYGRTGSVWTRIKRVNALSKTPHIIEQAPVYTYNDSRAQALIKQVCGKARVEPVNASMVYAYGEFTVSPASDGKEADVDAALSDLRKLLNAAKGGVIVLKSKPITPTYKESDFNYPKSLIGEFTTSYQGAETEPRNVNVRVAASRLHNTVVYPGEVFSAIQTLEPNEPAHGYVRSTVIKDGHAADDYGGGVCQVTGTLYNALLYAELPIVQRANHTLGVSYLDYGFDAAIAGNYFDLKFRNDTPHPLLLLSNMHNGELRIQVYGYEMHKASRTLRFISELTETLQPEPEKIQTDPSLPPGERQVLTQEREGYRYELYKIIYENGQATGKEKINASLYKPVQGLVAVGAPANP